MNHRIIQATNTEQLEAIEQLAEQIWHEHYTPIIGREQVLYMLDKFQSLPAMRQQITQDGYHYYSLLVDNQLKGYFAIQVKPQVVFLSKLYVTSELRGRGYGKRCLDYIKTLAADTGRILIELTVNKYNANSIAAYQSMGFEIIKEAVFDIGQGYVMDDYVMQLVINPAQS
ncbi:MAG: GNAT family N-acetyltransferase [Kangiellaceae bacterium]|jgi:GNAT superfamily N-acetyltransferase|nr:GNAT family N-acetyltransferase [Kangiellaceae bacterium]